MRPPRRTVRTVQKLLARCPACSSKLIYPIDLAGWDSDTVVSRRCPECEHRDVVLTAPLPAALWFARNTRQRHELAALCDAIADGLPLELDLAPGA
jgi:DNA-directed RNA polymerase subunit RPC12/RpoP